MKVHGPSLGIGAGITAIAIISVFSLLSLFGDEKELILEEAETLEQEPQKIGLSVFTDNGSPYLGDPSAPITHQKEDLNVLINSGEQEQNIATNLGITANPTDSYTLKAVTGMP